METKTFTEGELRRKIRQEIDAQPKPASQSDLLAVRIGREYLIPTADAVADTEALQRALDANPNRIDLGGNGEGTPFIANASLIGRTGNKLCGSGRGTTFIKLADGVDDDLITTADYGAGGVLDFEIADLTLDGNKANNSAGSGILADCTRSRFENLRVLNCADDGLNIQESNAETAATCGDGGVENVLQDIRPAENGRDGVYLASHDYNANEIHSVQNGRTNIFLATVGLCTNSHAWNHSAAGAGPYGFQLQGRANCVNCTSEGAATAMVLLEGAVNHWIGGEVFNGSGLPNRPCFKFTAGSFNHLILGAYIHDFGTGGAFDFQAGGGDGSRIQAHVHDPGAGNPAGVGTPADSVRFQLRRGGSTGLGSIAGDDVSEVGYTFKARNAGSMPNNTLFKDSADGKLKFKDNGGTVNALY